MGGALASMLHSLSTHACLPPPPPPPAAPQEWLSDMGIVAQANTFTLAGYETTADTLGGAASCLLGCTLYFHSTSSSMHTCQATC